MSTGAEDFAVEIAQDHPRKRTTGDATAWLQAIKGLTRSQCWQILDTFTAKGITPADFGKAKHRMFPPEKCQDCADIGQLWDGAQYHFCTCDKGEHMKDLNARLLAQSEADRPVWLRGTTEGMRRLEVVE